MITKTLQDGRASCIAQRGEALLQGGFGHPDLTVFDGFLVMFFHQSASGLATGSLEKVHTIFVTHWPCTSSMSY